jgi:hypothetical protein
LKTPAIVIVAPVAICVGEQATRWAAIAEDRGLHFKVKEFLKFCIVLSENEDVYFSYPNLHASLNFIHGPEGFLV